jgi:superfamily I DNA/RNA helicase
MNYRPNKEQKKFIVYTDGPLFVIAGSGSGKTFTLVESDIRVIQDKNLESHNLLIS